MPPLSNVSPLPTSTMGSADLCPPRRNIGVQQFGLFLAAFGHTPEGGHVVADVVAAEDFGGRAQLLRFFGGGFGQIGRRADVGASVGQIFAQVHAV